MKKLRIALIAGGWSRERPISLLGGENVLKALDKRKYEVIILDPLNDIQKILENSENIDLGFILLHGKHGEDGCLQGLMEMLQIPYVGSGVLASAMAANKRIAKEIFRSQGIQVAEDIIIKKGSSFSLKKISKKLGNKTIVKPLGEGSSFGMTVCEKEEELEKGIETAFNCGNEIMIEAFIDGREITCCVLGTHELETLPIIEIIPGGGSKFFDYEAKYKPGATNEICPAQIDRKMGDKIRRYAIMAHEALGCRLWSRSDMIICGEELFMLETNTIPGMTQTSLFPLAAKAAGMSFSDLTERLVTLSLEESKVPGAGPVT
jgi:D-alanine-D-alanine ligase